MSPSNDAPLSWWSCFAATLLRDLQRAWSKPGQSLTPLLFAALTISLFPFVVGTDADLLRSIAPAVIWIAAALANLLALDRLFRDDHASGMLSVMRLHPAPLTVFVFGKLLAHWLITGLPLVLASPLLAVWLQLPVDQLPLLLLSLLIGTPVLTLIGAILAALTLEARGAGGMLLGLLLLPMYVPVMIFGAGALNAASRGLPAAAPLYLLAAILVAAIVSAPFATAAALSWSRS